MIFLIVILGLIMGVFIKNIISMLLNLDNANIHNKHLIRIISILSVTTAGVLLYNRYYISYEFFRYFSLALILIVIGVIDMLTKDVYIIVVIVGGIIGGLFLAIGCLIFGQAFDVRTYILGTIVITSCAALLILITKGMGWGDAWILLICGLFIQFNNMIYVLIYALIVALPFSIAWMVLLKKKKDIYYKTLPLGPFIAIAGIFVSITNLP